MTLDIARATMLWRHYADIANSKHGAAAALEFASETIPALLDLFTKQQEALHLGVRTSSTQVAMDVIPLIEAVLAGDTQAAVDRLVELVARREHERGPHQ